MFVLGVIAYELVTGQRAYRGDTPAQIAQGDPRRTAGRAAAAASDRARAAALPRALAVRALPRRTRARRCTRCRASRRARAGHAQGHRRAGQDDARSLRDAERRRARRAWSRSTSAPGRSAEQPDVQRSARRRADRSARPLEFVRPDAHVPARRRSSVPPSLSPSSTIPEMPSRSPRCPVSRRRRSRCRRASPRHRRGAIPPAVPGSTTLLGLAERRRRRRRSRSASSIVDQAHEASHPGDRHRRRRPRVRRRRVRPTARDRPPIPTARRIAPLDRSQMTYGSARRASIGADARDPTRPTSSRRSSIGELPAAPSKNRARARRIRGSARSRVPPRIAPDRRDVAAARRRRTATRSTSRTQGDRADPSQQASASSEAASHAPPPTARADACTAASPPSIAARTARSRMTAQTRPAPSRSRLPLILAGVPSRWPRSASAAGGLYSEYIAPDRAADEGRDADDESTPARSRPTRPSRAPRRMRRRPAVDATVADDHRRCRGRRRRRDRCESPRRPSMPRVAVATPDAGAAKPPDAGSRSPSSTVSSRSPRRRTGRACSSTVPIIGATPLKLPGSPDRHTIAVLLPGHELYVAQVDGHGAFEIPLKEVTPIGRPRRHQGHRCKDKDRYYVFVDGKPTGMTCPTERIEVERRPAHRRGLRHGHRLAPQVRRRRQGHASLGPRESRVAQSSSAVGRRPASPSSLCRGSRPYLRISSRRCLRSICASRAAADKFILCRRMRSSMYSCSNLSTS